jgi:hypothetical protein
MLMAGAPHALAGDDPADPGAAAAADRYRSGFADYRRYDAPARPPWRDLMQEVEPAGEHAGHRHAAPATPPEPEPDHTGHSHHR